MNPLPSRRRAPPPSLPVPLALPDTAKEPDRRLLPHIGRQSLFPLPIALPPPLMTPSFSLHPFSCLPPPTRIVPCPHYPLPLSTPFQPPLSLPVTPSLTLFLLHSPLCEAISTPPHYPLPLSTPPPSPSRFSLGPSPTHSLRSSFLPTLSLAIPLPSLISSQMPPPFLPLPLPNPIPCYPFHLGVLNRSSSSDLGWARAQSVHELGLDWQPGPAQPRVQAMLGPSQRITRALI